MEKCQPPLLRRPAPGPYVHTLHILPTAKFTPPPFKKKGVGGWGGPNYVRYLAIQIFVSSDAGKPDFRNILSLIYSFPNSSNMTLLIFKFSAIFNGAIF